MKHNKLFKGITATALALTVPMSMLAVGGLSVSAAESDETEIVAGTKIYFDVESAGWKNYRNIYCHIWRADGTGEWPNWQAKKERCVKEDSGLYSYDVTKTGNADEIVASGSHNYYCVIFSADSGAQTYNVIMNGDCLGDTCYVTGNVLESPQDSDRSCLEVAWRNHPECGTQKIITSTGRVIGTTLADGTTDVTILADFLLTYITDYGIADTEKTDHTAQLAYELGVSYDDLLECVQGKLAASVESGDRTQESADLVERTVIKVLKKPSIIIIIAGPYDMNCDGEVDVLDVTDLQFFISGQDVYIIYDHTDVNKDGKLDVQDLTALQIYIASQNKSGGSASTGSSSTGSSSTGSSSIDVA